MSLCRYLDYNNIPKLIVMNVTKSVTKYEFICKEDTGCQNLALKRLQSVKNPAGGSKGILKQYFDGRC